MAGIISSQKIYGLCGLKHHIVEITGDVTMRIGRTDVQPNEKGKVGLFILWAR